MSRVFRFTRGSLLTYAGLLVAIVGLLVQWAADPARFADASASFGVTVPPGILFIAACGVLMLVTSRWWWSPLFAVLIAFWIDVMGTVSDQLPPNLVSPHLGTIVGTVVMGLGLLLAGIAGVYTMVTGFRARRRPTPVTQS